MYDVIIIGAGIVGSLTALRLSDLGYRCLILEQGDLKHSASTKSAGGIYLQLQPQIASLGDFVIQKAIDLIPLLQETIPAWHRLRERLPFIPFKQTGGIIVAFNEDEVRLLQQKNKIESDYGLSSRLLKAKEVRYLSADFSSEIKAASYMAEEGHCHPERLMTIIASELQRKQVDIQTQAQVVKFELSSNGIYLDLKNGLRLLAGKVILATGAHTGSILPLLNLPSPLSSLPLQMMSLGRADFDVPVLTRCVGAKLSVKSMYGELWVGGGWPAVERSDLEVEIDSENTQKNLECAIRVFPRIQSYSIRSEWGGYAAWTDDGLPIIGACPGFENIFLACGGNGFSLAPLYSESLVKLVKGEKLSPEFLRFSLSRFLHSHQENDLGIPPD